MARDIDKSFIDANHENAKHLRYQWWSKVEGVKLFHQLYSRARARAMKCNNSGTYGRVTR